MNDVPPLSVPLLAFNTNWISLDKLHVCSLFMKNLAHKCIFQTSCIFDRFAYLCQLPHPHMERGIAVFENKAVNATTIRS